MNKRVVVDRKHTTWGTVKVGIKARHISPWLKMQPHRYIFTTETKITLTNDVEPRIGFFVNNVRIL